MQTFFTFFSHISQISWFIYTHRVWLFLAGPILTLYGCSSYKTRYRTFSFVIGIRSKISVSVLIGFIALAIVFSEFLDRWPFWPVFRLQNRHQFSCQPLYHSQSFLSRYLTFTLQGHFYLAEIAVFVKGIVYTNP